MKQLYCLLLPLSVASSFFSSCSPRAYLGSRAAPAAQVRPVLASATVAVPRADPASLLPAGLASAAPALAQPTPAAQPPLGRAACPARKARTERYKPLAIKPLAQPMLRRTRHRAPEIAGTPTGLEGLGGAFLLLALLAFAFLALVGVALLLLTRLTVRLLENQKRRKR